MIRRKRCKAVGCHELIITRPQKKDQKYCSKPKCQRQRKNKWQRKKRQTDKDYRANDAAARQNWAEKNPRYSRLYREAHPGYVERNRQQQRERNKRRSEEAGRENETAAVREAPNTGWQLMELAGKRYQVKELVGGRIPRENPMGDRGKGGINRSRVDCKRGRVNRVNSWDTTAGTQLTR
jgi:hypothetical protein